MILPDFVKTGNVFQEKDSGTYIRVDGIDLNKQNDGFRIYFTGSFPEGWQAVPVIITDEILRKCGFIPCGIVGDTFSHSKAYRFKLHRLEDGTYQFNAHRPIILRELHRLQNLFFELEEISLEVNL